MKGMVSNLKKTILILIFLSIISKFLGFGREIFFSYFYGASYISDAYIIALTIPIVIFSFIGKAISNAYIPMYSKIESQSGTYEANKYTSNLINLLIIISLFIIFLGLVFTENIVRVFASGFTDETLDLAISMTRLSLFSMLFTPAIHVVSALLQLKGKYHIPALIGIPMNLVMIITIVISYKFNLLVLAVGIPLSIMAQLIFLTPFIRKENFEYKKTFDFKDPNVIAMVYLAIPVIIGVAVNDINKIVDKTLASQLSVGGISALNCSQSLNGFVQGIIVLSITTAMYPVISKMAVNKDIKGLKKILLECIVAISVLIMPISLGAMIFSKEIVGLLFGRGAFDLSAMEMTSNALFFYSIGMIGYGLREVLSRPFYSLQNTKIPMINSSIGVVLNIILNLILSKYLGIGGLALATSISAIFTAFLMSISLRKKIGSFGMKQISISFMKILCASLLMGFISKLSFNYLLNSFSQNISLLLAIGIGATSYFVIVYFMKIEEFDVLVRAFKKKLGRGVA